MKKKLIIIPLILMSLVSHARALDSLETMTLDFLLAKINALESTAKTHGQSISIFSTNTQLDDRAKYTLVHQNIPHAQEAMKELHRGISIFTEKLEDNQFGLQVALLSNPQSNILGFNFHDRIIELIKQDIQPEKKSFTTKLMATIESISESPIIKQIPAISPALSVSNSVVALLRGTSVVNKEVDIEKVKKFEESLSRYTEFYSALNEANVFFNNAIQLNNEKANSLHDRLIEKSVRFASYLKYTHPNKGEGVTTKNHSNDFFKKFNEQLIKSYFDSLERETAGANNHHRLILANNPGLRQANNEIGEIIQLVDEYASLIESYVGMRAMYTNKILAALDKAERSGISSPEKIAEQKAEFNRIQKNVNGLHLSNADLYELGLIKSKINYRVTIL